MLRAEMDTAFRDSIRVCTVFSPAAEMPPMFHIPNHVVMTERCRRCTQVMIQASTIRVVEVGGENNNWGVLSSIAAVARQAQRHNLPGGVFPSDAVRHTRLFFLLTF